MSKQEKLFGDTEPEVRKNIPQKEAKEFAIKILTEMAFDIHCKTSSIVGSIRREKETVNDIDFVVLPDHYSDWLKLRNYCIGDLKAKKVVSGDKIHRFIIEGIQVDFYRATEENFGILKLIRTGSAEHNIFLARLAIKKGMRLLYSTGLTKGAKTIAGASEITVFDRLGLPFIEPKFREIAESGKPMWELR